jgi:predicted RNA-binding protein YlxR (DUF448 family)
VACHTVRAKRELVRIVRSPTGELAVDLRGKTPGRGAYLDPDQACLDRGLREGALAKALEIPVDAATAERLKVELMEAALVRQKETAECPKPDLGVSRHSAAPVHGAVGRSARSRWLHRSSRPRLPWR